MWIARYQAYLRRWGSNLWTYLSSLKEANRIQTRTDFSQSRKPVLLLYGFGATRRSVAILEARLRRDGFDVFSLRLGGFLGRFNTHHIDALAQYVAGRIEDLYARYPLPRMAIIGYSKGGLIGRYYLTQLNGDKRIHTLITLATPHQGHPAGWFGAASRGLRQMAPNSMLMKKMQAAALPASVYIASIFSEDDRVCPPRYSRLVTADDRAVNISLQHLGHSDFVIKRTAYDAILKELNTGFQKSDPGSTLDM